MAMAQWHPFVSETYDLSTAFLPPLDCARKNTFPRLRDFASQQEGELHIQGKVLCRGLEKQAIGHSSHPG